MLSDEKSNIFDFFITLFPLQKYHSIP